MPMTCSRCGGELAESEVNERFQGVCPRCLAQAAVGETPVAAQEQGPPPLAPGQTFQGMEIVEVLGRGGMGVVYKARQPHLDRFVALKVLPRALADDPQFVERFRREAKALASLTHANIVGVYDFGIADGTSYLVMEYVDGTSLRGALAGKKLSPEAAMAIVPQLCDALQYAHEEGIVHRDIKPENILLDRKGRVKIADFGLAKIVGGEVTRLERITRTGYVLGTPSYMAPEQLEDPQKVDHRVDIYSMGVVFYEMLTGELPLGAFAPPSKKVEVDVRLDEVVLKTLAKEPERRYQHASEVREDVTQITRVPAGRMVLKAPERRGSWAALIVVAVGGLALLGSWLALRTRTPLGHFEVPAMGFASCSFALLCVSRWGPPARKVKAALMAVLSVGIIAFSTAGAAEAVRHWDRPGWHAAQAPAWFERIVMSDDDLPGMYEFDSPGRNLAPGPFRAGTPDEVNVVIEYLQKASIGWITLPRFSRAVLVPMRIPSDSSEAKETAPEHKMAYAALLADSEETARVFLSRLSTPSGCGQWVHQEGAAIVFAFGYHTEDWNQDNWHQMIDWLSMAIGAPAPFTLPRASSLRLDEEDLPASCSLSQEATRPDDPRLAIALKSAGLPIAPGDISEAMFQQFGPSMMRVFALNVPRASVRRKLCLSKCSTGWGRGSLVVLEDGGGQSAAMVSGQINARLYPQMFLDRLARLSFVASLDVPDAEKIVAAPAGRGLEAVQCHSLTAVVLAGLAREDVTWERGCTPRMLLDDLEAHSDTEGKVSILSGCYRDQVSADATEVVVPGCVRFHVEFGGYSIHELRLPRSGRRFLGGSGGGPLQEVTGHSWREAPLSGRDLREGIEDAARAVPANCIISPEVWGPLDPSGGYSTWQDYLDFLLSHSDALYWRSEGGILCFAPRTFVARRNVAGPAKRVLATDPAAPHVTMDLDPISFKRAALRIAEVGKTVIDIAPDVKGQLSLRLVDVPWTDALEALVETCGFQLSDRGSGRPGRLLVSKAPELPPTPLERLFFHEEDVPQGWVWYSASSPDAVRSSWAVTPRGIRDVCSSHGLADTEGVEEACSAGFQKASGPSARFLIVRCRDDECAAHVESKAKTIEVSGSSVIVLRKGAILAVVDRAKNVGSEADSLIAKLRERMGLK